jgi:cytidylate kinase
MTVITIDGPAGAGKSTVARAVANAMGYRYVDTGAMYRAVALVALEQGIRLDDGDAVGKVARKLDVEATAERVTVGARDITGRIRGQDVTDAVSVVAAHPAVRRALVERQRAIAKTSDVVMEGRDTGSAVAPEAEVKIFLVASSEERARRRARELGLPEDETTLGNVRGGLDARDEQDAGRAASPFRKPVDALEIDSTGLSPNEVVAAIVAAAREVTDGDR